MSRNPRFRVFRNGDSLPFVEKFNDLDKEAQRTVVHELLKELASLASNPTSSIGKQLRRGNGLRQSGQPRYRGAATRYLHERFGDEIVLYGVFVKSRNSDNDGAIDATLPRQRIVSAARAAGSAGLDSVTA